MIVRPGADGDPVPDGSRVIRLAVRSKDLQETGKVLPLTFKLSSTERQDKPARLSVFVEDLTTPAQAAVILGRESYTLVVRLEVDQVGSLKVEPDLPAAPGLDVQWHPIDDTRPGASGHAGVTGLDHSNGAVRKSFRVRLADIAVVEELGQP